MESGFGKCEFKIESSRYSVRDCSRPATTRVFHYPYGTARREVRVVAYCTQHAKIEEVKLIVQRTEALA